MGDFSGLLSIVFLMLLLILQLLRRKMGQKDSTGWWSVDGRSAFFPSKVRVRGEYHRCCIDKESRVRLRGIFFWNWVYYYGRFPFSRYDGWCLAAAKDIARCRDCLMSHDIPDEQGISGRIITAREVLSASQTRVTLWTDWWVSLRVVSFCFH